MCTPTTNNPAQFASSSRRDGFVNKTMPKKAPCETNTRSSSSSRSESNRPPCWMPHRAVFMLLANFLCIYLDLVASNYALKRWQMLLSLDQKASLPDVVHDNFAFYENHIFKEWPTIIMYLIIVLGFLVPYDLLGLSPHQHAFYRRGECSIRFFETRCLLELMRACTVFATTMSDPHGLHCIEIETHEVDDIWNTWTFARCGDNIYSGHASHLMSLALCIQTYFLPMRYWRASYTYWFCTAAMWISVVGLNFYIIVSRMHYTVDVLIACFLVPSLWFAWVGVTGPCGIGGQIGVRQKHLKTE